MMEPDYSGNCVNHVGTVWLAGGGPECKTRGTEDDLKMQL